MANNDFFERLREAGLSLGDTINRAGGGSNNMYGAYIEQKNKREQMEREAELARQKNMIDAYNRSLESISTAPNTRKNVIGFDPSTGMNVLIDNPNYSASSIDPNDPLIAERKMYATQKFLPVNRKELLRMDPVERMNYLRGQYTTQSPTGNRYAMTPDEVRRQSKLQADKIISFGKIVDVGNKQETNLATDAIGMNIDDALAIGRAEPVNVNGKTKYKVLSGREWDRKTKSFSNTETESINSRYDVAKSFKNVKDTLASLGDLPKDKIFDGVEFEKVDSKLPGVGIISIPARINLVGQLAKDPKYTAVKRELEQAFQAYRKIVTGAQASVEELKYLREIFPKLTDKPEVFIETINNIIEKNGRDLETRLNTWSDVGRDVTKLRDRYETEYKGKYMSTSSNGSSDQYSTLASQKGVKIRFK